VAISAKRIALLRLGEAHQPEQRVRRDREEARLDEGEQREPPFGLGCAALASVQS
jgi:hypothetical protein